jgi:hypothetical protein
MRISIDMKPAKSKRFLNAKISTLLLGAVACGILVGGTACDGVPGGVATSNEVVPKSATLIFQGSLTGTDVSGTAQVYSLNGTILLYLAGLSTPTGTRYTVFLENGAPTSPFYFTVLKATQGNQLYSTGLPNPGTFSRVALRVNSSTVSTEVAAATLLSTQYPVTPALKLEF